MAGLHCGERLGLAEEGVRVTLWRQAGLDCGERRAGLPCEGRLGFLEKGGGASLWREAGGTSL